MSNTPLVNTRGRAQEPRRAASCCGGQILCSKGTPIAAILTERLAGCNLGAPYFQVFGDAYSLRAIARCFRLHPRARRVPAAARPQLSEPYRPGHAALP